MSGKYWEITQRVLQSEDDPLVKRPRLTEELLRRPPFRFLHDVVSAVQRETQFLQGLFTEAEQNARLLATDKEAKLTYLKKLIRAVSLVSGDTLEVEPGNVLAGLEAEQTNTLLQVLGNVAREGSREDVVAQVLQEEENEVEESVPDQEVLRPPSRPSSERANFDIARSPVVPETETTNGSNCDVLVISPGSEDEQEVLQLEGPPHEEHTPTPFSPLHLERPTSSDQVLSSFDPEREETSNEAVGDAPTELQRPVQSESRVSRPSSRRSTRPQSARKAPPSRPGTTQSFTTQDGPACRRRPPVEDPFEAQPILDQDSSTLASAKHASVNEFSDLESTLQRFTQLLVPLGKSIANLENAPESLSQEQSKWREHVLQTDSLEGQDPVLESLEQRSEELDQAIEDSQEQIRSLKQTVERNHTIIDAMLRSIVS